MPQTPAGQRIQAVTFQRNTAGRSAMGGLAAASWEALGSRRAKVLYGTGAERRGAAGELAVQPATFRLLADSLTRTITVKDRIAFLGGYWDITSIVPIGGPQATEIEFTAVAART
jgi:head-tail adaptor